jgi:DNA polymerase-3 subunit chi
MEISFYQLSTSPLAKALPLLVEKAYEAGLKSWVVASPSGIKAVDEGLWTTYQAKFLPHGTQNPEVQPIFISTEVANPDGRQVLIITSGAKLGSTTLGYSKVLDIFDGNNEDELAAARARWKEYKNQNYDLKYWSQDDAGKWVQKQ